MARVMIRYGEIALKSGPVRDRFECRLVKNIKAGLKSARISHSAKRGFGRIFLETPDFESAKPVLSRVFGIVSFSPCIVCQAWVEEICRECASLAKREWWKEKDKFAVKTRRVGSHNFSSAGVNIAVGDILRKETGGKVDLENPERIMNVEIRQERAYLYTEKFEGPGGLPIGTQRKALCMISGKRDVIAAWLMCKRGSPVLPVYLNLSAKKIGEFHKVLERWHYGFRLERAVLEGKEKYIGEIVSRLAENPENNFPNLKVRVVYIGAVALGEELEPEEMRKMKKASKLPVFYPLFGFEEHEIKRLERKVFEG